MITAALVCAAVAALIHVFIFWLEAFAWTTPRGLATFGMSAEQAGATRELAFNQGFYNLFLAIVTVAGGTLVVAGQTAVGAALIFAGAGSMVAAGLVLLISSPSNARAALVQLTAPAIAVALLAVALI